ncbi:hypothetical protein O1M54_17325 [Streptomyces diastatochromogenes]|nr:hypothetical protein [Streptomyces diastatochromogenes]
MPTGLLVLPGLGVLHCPSGRVRLSSGPGWSRIADDTGHGEVVLARPAVRPGPGASRRAGGGRGWFALRTLPGGTIRLDDLDPYRLPSPDTGRGALRAADRSDAPGDVGPALAAGLRTADRGRRAARRRDRGRAACRRTAGRPGAGATRWGPRSGPHRAPH